MNAFFATLLAVSAMLLVAAPGYIMVKTKMLGERAMADFSRVLMYICQPCLAVYTFSSADFSAEKLVDIGIVSILALAIHIIILGGSFLLLRKRFSDVGTRILTIATAFANCAFFGIPIIEAIFGKAVAAELIIFTTVYATVMNIFGWTVGSAIISGDVKMISAKRLFINPTMIGFVIAVPFFIFNLSLPNEIFSMIELTGRMTTPLSMLIMGMRLATAELKTIFASYKTYIAVLAKGILMPLVGFLLVYFLPIPLVLKKVFYIICACPSASIVLNFSELIGEGQREASAAVLLSTIMSIITLPGMVLLLPLL